MRFTSELIAGAFTMSFLYRPRAEQIHLASSKLSRI